MAVRQNTLLTIATNPQSVEPLTLVLQLTTPVRRGQPLTARLVASGGAGGYVYSTSGTLPPGCGPVNGATGVIPGTPTANGHYIFTGTVQDSVATVVNATFAIDVGSAWSVVAGTPPNAISGRAYQYQFMVRDNSGPFWAIITSGYTIAAGLGSPPTGLTLSDAGLLSGTPSGTLGRYAFTVRCTQGADSIDIPCTMTLVPALSVSPPTVTLAPSYPVGVALSIPITIPAGQGLPPYRVAVTANALPAGLSIVPVPTVSRAAGGIVARVVGTPTAITNAATPIPVATITDATGDTNTISLPIKVGNATLSLASGQVVIGNTNGDGTSETIDFMSWFFGAGADGDLVFDGTNTFASTLATKSGSVYTIRRDVYAHDLAVSGSAKVNTNGYAIYCSGALDLSNAGVLALGNNESNDGAVGSGSTGGAGGAVSGGTLRPGAAGGAGGNATIGSSGAGGTVPTDPPIPANGGDTWTTAGSGTGGDGSAGTGGVSGANTVIAGRAGCPLPFGQLIVAAAGIKGGAGGAGGGGGGSSATGSGGGGGGGGAGGGVMMICAREIITSAATATGAIKALPGDGGAGAGVANASVGAGGGGKGGGGGYIHIRYVKRTGTPVTDLIWADGGIGGAGGVNSANAARNGTAGDGGCGGRIEALSILDCSVLHETLTDPGTYSGTTPGTPGKARLTF